MKSLIWKLTFANNLILSAIKVSSKDNLQIIPPYIYPTDKSSHGVTHHMHLSYLTDVYLHVYYAGESGLVLICK